MDIHHVQVFAFRGEGEQGEIRKECEESKSEMPVSPEGTAQGQSLQGQAHLQDACGADQASVKARPDMELHSGREGGVSEHDRCWALTIRQDANGIRPEERKGIQKGKDRRGPSSSQVLKGFYLQQ